MFGYGIFVIVVTIIFIIYYLVMINLDLSKMKTHQSDNVEVIHAGSFGEEKPTVVSEHDDGSYSIERPGEEKQAFKPQDIPDGQPVNGQQAGASSAATEDTPSERQQEENTPTPAEEQLQDEAEAAESQCAAIKTVIEGGVTAGSEADDEIEKLAAEFASEISGDESSVGVA